MPRITPRRHRSALAASLALAFGADAIAQPQRDARAPGAQPRAESPQPAPAPQARALPPGSELRIYEAPGRAMNLQALTAHIGVSAEPLQESLILVSGTPEQHEQFRRAMEQVRALASGRVLVEVALRSIPASTVVVVGQPEPAEVAAAPLVRYAQGSTARGSQLEIESSERFMYISDLTPIVGTGAAAMDPSFQMARSGLVLSVGVGREAPQQQVALSVQGSLEASSLAQGPVIGAPDAERYMGELKVERLTTRTRSLNADVLVAEGVPTVVALADDPADPSRAIAMVMRVTPMP